MPINVVHIINSLRSGGAERQLVRVVTGTPPEMDIHHSVAALLDGGPFGQELAARGIPTNALGPRSALAWPAATASLARWIRDQRPDVIMAWLYQASLAATVVAPSASNARLIWNLRGTAKDAGSSSVANRLTFRALRQLSRAPWAIAANSHAGIQDHRALGLHNQRWVLLPNGFDPDVWYPSPAERHRVRQELGFESQDVVGVAVARCDPQKDHEGLLRAASIALQATPRSRLVLIGRGTEHLTIPTSIQGHVVRLGERADIPSLLRAFDFGVLASAYGEGLPNSVAECMLTCLPCVATNTGDTARLIGDTGWIVPPRDPSALSEALTDAYSSPSSHLKDLGAAARDRVKARYSMAATLRAYESVWRAAATHT